MSTLTTSSLSQKGSESSSRGTCSSCLQFLKIFGGGGGAYSTVISNRNVIRDISHRIHRRTIPRFFLCSLFKQILHRMLPSATFCRALISVSQFPETLRLLAELYRQIRSSSPRDLHGKNQETPSGLGEFFSMGSMDFRPELSWGGGTSWMGSEVMHEKVSPLSVTKLEALVDRIFNFVNDEEIDDTSTNSLSMRATDEERGGVTVFPPLPRHLSSTKPQPREEECHYHVIRGRENEEEIYLPSIPSFSRGLKQVSVSVSSSQNQEKKTMRKDRWYAAVAAFTALEGFVYALDTTLGYTLYHPSLVSFTITSLFRHGLNPSLFHGAYTTYEKKLGLEWGVFFKTSI